MYSPLMQRRPLIGLLEIIIENAAYHRYFNEIVNLTDQMQTYEFVFTMTDDDIVSLKFLMGNVAGIGTVGAHDIYIDNVVLQVNNPPVLRPPQLIADTENNNVHQEITITFVDDASWRSAITC